MAQFWRPGEKKPDLPPSLEVDRDDSGNIPLYTRSEDVDFRGQRERLPVSLHRSALLYLVESHATTIVIGQTGSGKTTQIPQFLLEAGWAAGDRQIVCTQPRRIAVQTVAARVAEEMRVKLGTTVGYAIRFEKVTSPETKVKYVTDGVLLREMMEDPLLLGYSVIMIDEAHERSTATDVLLGLLKKIQRRRTDLRLVIASATLEAEQMAAFYDTSGERTRGAEVAAPSRKPAILAVEGRMHPVQLLYLEEPASDYLQASVSTAMAIHRHEPPGDILVFLTGQEEVDTAVQLLADEAMQLPGNFPGILALPLYAGMSRGDQEVVFRPAPRNKRKVIVATNIAETSLTLEGVVYVVDSGFSKQRFYNPVTDVDSLVVAPVSRASAQQRAGRAGRVRAGKCYRLYTEGAFRDSMAAASMPEIQRSDLAPVVLQLKSLGIDNIMRFDWLSPPAPEAMVRALELLFALDVLDADAKLTRPLGLQVAELPLEPMLARMLLAAGDLGCTEEAITVAASLCVQSIWFSSRGRQKELDECRERFAAAEGDHVTYLNVYEAFLRSHKSPRWCHDNCINYRAMVRVDDVRSQLQRTMQRMGVEMRSCGSDTVTMRKAVVSGFFSHAAQLLPHGDGTTFRTLRGGLSVKIHPSSVLFRATPKWVVYHSVVVTESEYIREVAAIDPSWLTELAPHFYQLRDVRAMPPAGA